MGLIQEGRVTHLEFVESPKEQLQLAHVQIDPKLASLCSSNTQIERHVAIPRRLGRIEADIESVFDPQDFHVWVLGYSPYAGCHGGHVIEDDGLAAYVQQPRHILEGYRRMGECKE